MSPKIKGWMDELGQLTELMQNHSSLAVAPHKLDTKYYTGWH